MVVATTPAASRRFRHDLKNSTRNTWSDFRGAVDGGVVVAAQKGGGSRYNLPRTVTVTPAAMFMFLAPHLYG